MGEHEGEEQGGLAVPGPESHESEETLSSDEVGSEGQPMPPPSEPAAPAPASSPSEGGLWARLMGKLTGRG
jgi:hypothetical protein